MHQLKADPLLTALDELLRTLDAGSCEHDSQWQERLHLALGRLAAAIQENVQAAEKSMKNVGEINPDLQNAPGTERHFQSTRAQLIKLSEQVYQLRADVRNASKDSPLDSAQLHVRGEEIRVAVENVRRIDNDFQHATVNTDLGSGE